MTTPQAPPDISRAVDLCAYHWGSSRWVHLCELPAGHDGHHQCACGSSDEAGEQR